MSLLEDILTKKGPCLSSSLVQILVEEHQLSNDAARKRVSRIGGDIYRLDGLPLPKNVKFIYLKKDFRSPHFWSALFKAFKDTNSAYWYAIAALKERNGIIPYNHFLIACGSPLKQKKHTPPDAILNRLKKNKIISFKEVDGVGPCVVLTENEQDIDIVSEMRARLVAEKILISVISEWAKNLGLVSYKMFKNRDDSDLPTVSTTLWDMAGPSYLSPLVKSDNNEGAKLKPGFFACDILFNENISEDGIQTFLRKCNALKSLSNVGRCMQMFIAISYQKEAFNIAKAKGIIPATVESLFGKDVSEGLVNLLQTLKDAANSVILDPGKFNILFDKLGKIEGAAGNLRGVLFEYFSASVVCKTYSTLYVKNNQIYKTKDNKSAESDVVAELNSGEILFIECKGSKPSGSVSHDEVMKWLQVRVPTIRRCALERSEWKSKKLIFQLWTTGKFIDESLRLLTTAQKNTDKYRLDFLDQNGVLEKIKECNDKEMLTTYNKCFLNHPLKI